ncbi:MAG: HIT domain-containing protein [Tenericutes bacterium]|jgi:histidine triad (HIT) family protein|nr:HIT domain-containing protein [Mycoplasmatota bacterium]
MNCVFCQIIKNKIPNYKIFEDNQIIVILDANPCTNGHSLIITKQHYENIIDIPQELLNHINEICKLLYPLFKKTLACEGLTIIQNNNYGQDVKHYHMHLIPRYKNDLFKNSFNQNIILQIEEIYHQIKEG